MKIKEDLTGADHRCKTVDSSAPMDRARWSSNDPIALKKIGNGSGIHLMANRIQIVFVFLSGRHCDPEM
jgi:hypothetical protein